MLEIKFSGRGGQGVVMASQILGYAFFRAGKFPQCYSLFGGERRGAPVVSFLRVDRKKILLKCEIRHPNELICFDPSLIDTHEIRRTMKQGGRILMNAPEPDGYAADLHGFVMGFVDARAIAGKTDLGHAINTSVLGAYCRFTNEVSLEDLETAIGEMIPKKVEANIAAARLGYENLVLSEEGD